MHDDIKGFWSRCQLNEKLRLMRIAIHKQMLEKKNSRKKYSKCREIKKNKV